MRKLKLIVFATVCWVAPLAAQQAPIIEGSDDCPFALRQASTKIDDQKPPMQEDVPPEGSLFDTSLRREAFAP